jgi:hypothetical protein
MLESMLFIAYEQNIIDDEIIGQVHPGSTSGTKNSSTYPG